MRLPQISGFAKWPLSHSLIDSRERKTNETGSFKTLKCLRYKEKIEVFH